MQKREQKQLLAATLLKVIIPMTIALLLSTVMTAINYGFGEAFLHNWIKGFVVACIVIPAALRSIPFVAAAVLAVLGPRNPVFLRSVVAVCVATTIECVIAFAVTVAQHGLGAGWLSVWGVTFVKALPMGFLIGFTMTFIVHPRLQRLTTQA